MFPGTDSSWRERAGRTAALVRAFVLLEDPDLEGGPAGGAGADVEGVLPPAAEGVLPPVACPLDGRRRRASRPGGRLVASSEEPAASYSPRPLRAKYHRR